MPAVDAGLRAGCGTGNKGSASSWDPPPLAPALTLRADGPSVRSSGQVLLIVMHESGIWRVRPGQT